MRGVNFILNRVFLFDIDGTLTPPRQSINEEFASFLEAWGATHTFYLTTGSDLPKVKEQLPQSILNLAAGIFCCMGNELFTHGGDHCVYRHEFTPSPALLEDLQSFLDHSDYPFPHRKEPHIEHRPGMINFSIPGRGSSLDDRRAYRWLDERQRERLTIRDVLCNKHTDLDVSIGGEISLDIYSRGNDKSQSIQYIMDHDQPS